MSESSFHLYGCSFSSELDRSKHIDLYIKIYVLAHMELCAAAAIFAETEKFAD